MREACYERLLPHSITAHHAVHYGAVLDELRTRAPGVRPASRRLEKA